MLLGSVLRQLLLGNPLHTRHRFRVMCLEHAVQAIKFYRSKQHGQASEPQ